MHEEVLWIGDSNVESADSNAAELEEVADASIPRGQSDAYTHQVYHHEVSFHDTGCLSDPPEIQLYYQTGIDQNRSKTYRCIRGTCDLQGGIHQKLVGILRLGMLVLHLRMLLQQTSCIDKISEQVLRNPLAFPNLGHYNNYLVDFVQQHTSQLLGEPVHTWWHQLTDLSISQEHFGIIPCIPQSEYQDVVLSEISHYRPSIQYLAVKTKLMVPYLPVLTDEEAVQFQKLVSLYLTRYGSIGKIPFDEMALDWIEGNKCTRPDVNKVSVYALTSDTRSSVPIRHIKAASKMLFRVHHSLSTTKVKTDLKFLNKRGVCWYCGKSGHGVRTCFSLLKHINQMDQEKQDAFTEQEVDQWQEMFEGHEDAPPQIDMEIDNLNELYSSRYESAYLSGSAIRDLLCTGQNTDTVITEFAQSVGNRPALLLGKINREEVAVCFDSGASGALISLKDAKKCGLTVLSGDFSAIKGIDTQQCVGITNAVLQLATLDKRDLRLQISFKIIDADIPIFLGNKIHRQLKACIDIEKSVYSCFVGQQRRLVLFLPTIVEYPYQLFLADQLGVDFAFMAHADLDKILASKIGIDGIKQFLVRWKNRTKESDQWLLREQLELKSPDALKSFESSGPRLVIPPSRAFLEGGGCQSSLQLTWSR
ncbi:hypothetical protein MP228_000602 [Amoeboaphelidium protococcarum]|nr:hypothetical protein MP228_000602 [Amoeboaphelidium protococcarum]